MRTSLEEPAVLEAAHDCSATEFDPMFIRHVQLLDSTKAKIKVREIP